MKQKSTGTSGEGTKNKGESQPTKHKGALSVSKKDSAKNNDSKGEKNTTKKQQNSI